MSKQIKIKVAEELSNLIEALQYEVTSRRDIITFMLSNNMDITTEQFQHYQKEFNEFYIQYETAKEELEKIYVIKEDNKNYNWNLDFNTNELTVTEK